MASNLRCVGIFFFVAASKQRGLKVQEVNCHYYIIKNTSSKKDPEIGATETVFGILVGL
jgi:hypothetical protein